MVIAVNTRFLQKNNKEGYGYFVQEIFLRLAIAKPQHQFIFIFDREYDQSISFPQNVIPMVVKPKAQHALSFLYWYNIKVPLAIKKYKPNILIQPFGFCGLFTKVPQLLVIHDLAFIHYPQFIAAHYHWFYKIFTPLFIKKANKIVTVSQFSKQDIFTNYKTNSSKINVVYSAAKTIFKPLDFDTKQQIKDGFAQGRDYFLFTGGIHPRKNLMTALKAFSIFKKWQNSNLKLLVAGRLAWKYDEIIGKLNTYKYKEDVVLLGYVKENDLAAITASAYAVIYPSFFEGFGVPIIEAMQSQVPVITSNSSSMPEIGGDAALYNNPSDFEALAKNMILLYKDENLRSQHIQKGITQAAKYTWDETSKLMWDTIIEINKKVI